MYYRLIDLATNHVIDISPQISELEASMASLCVQRNIKWADRYNHFKIES